VLKSCQALALLRGPESSGLGTPRQRGRQALGLIAGTNNGAARVLGGGRRNVGPCSTGRSALGTGLPCDARLRRVVRLGAVGRPSLAASATLYMFVLFPVVTIALGAWLADETVTKEAVTGAALVMLGVWFGALSLAPDGSPHAPPPATENPWTRLSITRR
jgi:hypothetical protein